jgi:hypothetical protein
LTTGGVCNLLVQFAFTLGSKSCRNHDHILLFRLRSPNMEGQVPVFIFIPQEQGGPVIHPGTGFHFRRLFKTSRAAVEVF